MGWPYPDFRKDPWFEQIKALFQAQDASVFATREDRNLVIMGGGTVSFDAATGVLTWGAALELNASITGFLWTIAAGNITLEEGEVMYVDLARAPTANVAVVASKASKVPPTDAAVMFAIRHGSRVYFRDGKVLNDGDSLPLFLATSTGGALLERLPIAMRESVTGVFLSTGLGGFIFNPSVYAGATTFTVQVVLNTKAPGPNADFWIRNLTDAEDVASSFMTTFVAVPTKFEMVLTIGDGAGEMKTTERMYEAWISTGLNPVDETLLGSAHLLVV
jgi:hypothetical protein